MKAGRSLLPETVTGRRRRLSATLAARIPVEIGCQLQQVFGMAEGLVNYTRLDDSAEKIIHTRGYPMCPDDEVWVADAEGNPLPQGKLDA